MVKYTLEIKTDSRELIEFLFLDCAEQFNKFGASLVPKNQETNKFLLENTELTTSTKKFLVKNFE